MLQITAERTVWHGKCFYPGQPLYYNKNRKVTSCNYHVLLFRLWLKHELGVSQSEGR